MAAEPTQRTTTAPGSGGAAEGIPPDARAPGGAWALAWTAVGCGVVAVVCAGIGAVPLFVALDGVEKTAAAEAAAHATRRSESDDAAALLEAVAESIVRDAGGELPEHLDLPLPDDPWGEPLVYRRSTPLRGSVRSAGPDGAHGTEDDVEAAVRVDDR